MTNRLWPADAVTGSPSYSGRAMRQALMAPLLAGATAARPLGAISGVRPGTPDTTVSVAALVWTIKPHAGVLDLEAALAAGPYGYAIDADVTGAVTAANATYARKDGLYVTLSDPAEGDGTATPGVAITYLAGTPAAAPVMPATPARSMLLARLDVPKSGSGSPTATWLAPVLAMAGGVRHYNSVGELPAGLPASESGIVAVIGTGASYAEYLWDGAAWLPVVEQGSNANGSYAKLASGLQICWLQTVRTDIAINAAYGALYLGSYTWTYPAAFKTGTVPVVTCSQFQSGTTAGWGTVTDVPTATAALLRGIDAFSAAAGPSVKIAAMAVGVWR